MSVNYQFILEETIKRLGDSKPTLLLHSCCAPCSSYVLEYLSEYFNITVYYYNPNIYPESEFQFRSEEQKKLIELMNLSKKVNVVCCDYDSQKFYLAVRGLENLPEGGERCAECFKLRLENSAQYARNNNFDYFTTTLTISPHKNAELLNNIGREISEKYGIKYLFSDFKKKNGYKRSCEISSELGLYRQNYCGCVFSMNDKN